MHELEKYIADTSISHRKDYGQFFTPLPVARLMASWTIRDQPKTILDPAFGLGIFYEAVMDIASDRNFRFVGYEIDRRILDYVNFKYKTNNLEIHNEDFLESPVQYYDAIICNPPYMRFQKFLKRHNILPIIEKQIGKKLLGYSNIASIFLVKALHELKPNGRLAFIMPFEFFNTGYGKEIKRSLLEEHLLKQIIIFSNEKDIFPDAITTVSILLCKYDMKNDPIKLTFISEKTEMENINYIGDYFQATIPQNELPVDQKWTTIINSYLFKEEKIPYGFCQLSYYGKVMRGIATGANEFFAINKTKVQELGIPKQNLTKCITKSQQIKKLVFTEKDFDELVKLDKPVFCFNVKELHDKNTLNYIKYGEEKGYNNRYLTRNRSPWFKVEHRKPAPILFGVFNRGRLKVVRNFSSAINFTCFHAFYPNMFGVNILNKLFVYFISDFGQRIIHLNKRIYGDRLDKFEPRDLNDVMCPNFEQFNLITDDEANRIIELANVDQKQAISLSNDLIERILNAQQIAPPDRYSAALHSGR
jgi:adenine-specific DNA-methyltransferase